MAAVSYTHLLPGAYVALFKKVEELGGISAAVPALAGYTLSAREVQPIQTYLQENLGRNEALVRQKMCIRDRPRMVTLTTRPARYS